MKSEDYDTGILRDIEDIRHYTGGDPCQYECGEPAEFVVVATSAAKKVTFAGCKSCLNEATIYPIENNWVDERTQTWRHS